METIKEHKAPYTLVILDLMDAYHYADVFDNERYKVLANDYSDFEVCVAVADRLFWALNPEDKTQKEWYYLDKGWDVRIYDADSRCVYKAHEKLPKE